MENKTGPHDYWFFLSYSNFNNNNYLRRFWKDLIDHLRPKTLSPETVDDEQIGFRDKKEIKVGANWRDSLSSALQTSRVLLCVYSNAYFKSEYCGKELTVFHQRVTSFLASLPAGAEPPRLIIPILWDNPRDLPPTLPGVVKDIQYKHEDFGELYAKKGLFYLMKIEEHDNKVAYDKFVMNIADIIFEQGDAHQMKPTVPAPAIGNVESAFYVQPAQPVGKKPALTQIPPRAAVPVAKGYDVAWFVYVAGREGDYQNIRTSRSYYGANGGYDWKPFHPVDERIGKIATFIASKNKFQPETLLMSQNLIENLRNAETNNTPVVIILDPWALKLDSYIKTMSELDMNRLATSIVLVVWNEGDVETTEKKEALLKLLGQTFPRSLKSKEVFRYWISSEKELKKELRAMLKSMSNKIMQSPNAKLPVETLAGSFPKLNVPADNSASETTDEETSPLPPGEGP